MRAIVTALAVALSCAATAGVADAGGAKPTTVRLGEYFYKPKKLTIKAGSSVRFVNVGKIEHTVADSTKSGSIRSRLIRPRPLKHGQAQIVRFRKRGTVYYLCTFHPTLMRGVIIVR